jgi:hypothetical protein
MRDFLRLLLGRLCVIHGLRQRSRYMRQENVMITIHDALVMEIAL